MYSLVMPLLSHLNTLYLFCLSAIPLLLFANTFWLLFLDPLRRVPGPFYAKWGSTWLALQCRLMCRSRKVHKLHQTHGDVIRIASDHVSINLPGALHEIYLHDRIYPKSKWYESFKYPTPSLIGDLDADEHTLHRKNLQPAFSLQAMKRFEPYMNKYNLALKELLLDLFHGQDSISLDISPWIKFQAFDVISDFVFGKPFGLVEAKHDSFNLVEAMEYRVSYVNAIGVLPLWIRPYMSYIPFDPFWRASVAGLVRIRKLVNESYYERKDAGDMSRPDLLSFMLSAKSENGEPLPDVQAISQATGMIIAGSDSTAASILHFIDFVSRDAKLQDKIQHELDTVFPGTPEASWAPNDADWANLPFMDAVLHEVLRLRPTAATGFERVVTRHGTSFGGYELPSGTIVSVPIYSLHRNPEIFPEPECFRPERWLGNDTSGAFRHFSMFSTGPRSCIGQNFAWMEIHKTLALLFRLFKVTRDFAGPTALLEGAFLRPVECRVVLKRRT